MVVLVTGASKGIGFETALKYAKEGYDVVINYNNSMREALTLENKVKSLGVNALLVKCDISNEEEVINMIDLIKKEYGKIDVLINNAGIALDTTFD